MLKVKQRGNRRLVEDSWKFKKNPEDSWKLVEDACLCPDLCVPICVPIGSAKGVAVLSKEENDGCRHR